MDAATIEREARSLPVAERAVLADHLLQSLDLENPARMEKWGREADRRLNLYERGEMTDVDGPTAVAAIRRRLT
ncbi:MAG: addiction module protein [Verrucomicrobiota bacterium]|jgi:hypothetical protein